MEVRQGVNQKDFSFYDGARLREELLIEDVFGRNEIKFVYSQIDRMIVGGVIPGEEGVRLQGGEELRARYFLERREMGVINIGGGGRVTADGIDYPMDKGDCLYLGRGAQNVAFYSASASQPAAFYINSCPAHKSCPARLIRETDAERLACGTKADCNERVINKYILPGRMESCQLVMGLTRLKEGSVWNTMPSHTHERRMEVYLYFDLKRGNAVFHFAGAPSDTRHLVVNERQAVLSPSFSIHSGVGTSNYAFVWGMCGENQDFNDMDGVQTTALR